MNRGLRPLLGLCMAFSLVGCEATVEDIERWKGTQRGPAKITAVVVDDRYPADLRGRAAVALIEINDVEHFQVACDRLEPQDRQTVVHAMVPLLAAMYASGSAAAPEQGPTDAQVLAKDAMADIYQWASADDQAVLREHLIDWITSDFNAHFLPGRLNIEVIATKIGPAAAMGIAMALTPENALVAEPMTKLVRDLGDAESKQIASANLVKVASGLGDRIRGDMWKALSYVCGTPVVDFSLQYATPHQGNVDEQVNALICVVAGDVEECAPGCGGPGIVDRLFKIAEDEEQDERVRAAAYDALRKHATKSHLDRFLAMLDDREAVYKATGLEIAVHLAGAETIVPILEKIGESRERWPWKLRSSRTHGEEYGLCNMGLGQLEQTEGVRDVLIANLDHHNPFVKGGVVNMLGIVGTVEDVPRLNALTSDGGRLTGWEPDRVGAQAREAIERINAADRPAGIPERRSRACGL
jgi:hypothetical protein